MITTKKIIFAYVVLFALEFVILLVWQFSENPRSEEIIVNEMRWETVFVCTTNTNIMENIQIVYFCLVCVFGCGVILKYWDSKATGETRWLLVALYNNLLLLLLLVVLTQTGDNSDNAIYNFTIPAYIFCIANVIFSFFLPKLIQDTKVRTGKSKSGSSKSETYSPKSRYEEDEDISMKTIKPDI